MWAATAVPFDRRLFRSGNHVQGQLGALGSFGFRRPAILVVDDDPGMCETVDWVLRRDGFDVSTASSGAEGLAMAGAGTFDLHLIDLRLPDMLGTELARALHRSPLVPFVIISAFLTTEITVEAMKIGASHVIEKPITVDGLRAVVFSLLENRVVSPAGGGSRETAAYSRSASPVPIDRRPRSAAERWATHVLRACESDMDLPTLGDWAAYLGVSATSLRESCDLLRIQPRDARDLMRLLRALGQSSAHDCEPETLLLVSDRRTLKTLFERGGLATGEKAGSGSLDRFLTNQRFVPIENNGLKVLRRLMSPNAVKRSLQNRVGGTSNES